MAQLQHTDRVNSIETLKEWLDKGVLKQEEYDALVSLPLRRS